MSSGLEAELRVLSQKADRLQVEVVELAESLASLLEPGAFGDWVLVDDEFPPLEFPEFQVLRTQLAHKGLEDGFPEVPQECVRNVARVLPCLPEEIVQRTTWAFRSGFLARVALETSTPFLKDPKVTEEEDRHWVVFYRHTEKISRRLSSKKCLEIALTVQKDPVWQGFPTVTELSVFCAGAGRLVPKLEKWTSPW